MKEGSSMHRQTSLTCLNGPGWATATKQFVLNYNNRHLHRFLAQNMKEEIIKPRMVVSRNPTKTNWCKSWLDLKRICWNKNNKQNDQFTNKSLYLVFNHHTKQRYAVCSKVTDLIIPQREKQMLNSFLFNQSKSTLIKTERKIM